MRPGFPVFQSESRRGHFLAAFGIANASLYFRWRLFGGYDKQAVGLLLVTGVIIMTYFMPSTRRR